MKPKKSIKLKELAKNKNKNKIQKNKIMNCKKMKKIEFSLK